MAWGEFNTVAPKATGKLQLDIVEAEPPCGWGTIVCEGGSSSVSPTKPVW